jgi:NAD(P)-dependent dehydrogenase (short-subunit alcohol dehydrogenase family)
MPNGRSLLHSISLSRVPANVSFFRPFEISAVGPDRLERRLRAAGGGARDRRADLVQSLEVIALAFADLLRHGAPHLARSARGSVVAVSSFVAHRFEGERPFAPSAAAKAALEALVRSAAAELGPQGVTVNAVAPGYTSKDPDRASALAPAAWAQAAEAIPLRRLAEPADIAGVIAFLLGPEARYITGQVIAVDGGLTLG